MEISDAIRSQAAWAHRLLCIAFSFLGTGRSRVCHIHCSVSIKHCKQQLRVLFHACISKGIFTIKTFILQSLITRIRSVRFEWKFDIRLVEIEPHSYICRMINALCTIFATFPHLQEFHTDVWSIFTTIYRIYHMHHSPTTLKSILLEYATTYLQRPLVHM